MPFLSFALLTNLLSLPVAEAQGAGSAKEEITRITGILGDILFFVDTLLVIAIALAFLFFFWGLATFIYKSGSGSSDTVQDAKNKMLWGLLAIFVLTSIWGIVYFLGLILLGENPGTRGTTTIQTFRIPEGSDSSGSGTLPCAPPIAGEEGSIVGGERSIVGGETAIEGCEPPIRGGETPGTQNIPGS